MALPLSLHPPLHLRSGVLVLVQMKVQDSVSAKVETLCRVTQGQGPRGKMRNGTGPATEDVFIIILGCQL